MLQKYVSYLIILFLTACTSVEKQPVNETEVIEQETAIEDQGEQEAAAIPAELKKLFAAGLKLMKDSNFSEASEHWEQVTVDYPDYAGVWLNLGLSQQQQGMFEEATESLIKAAQTDPEYCLAYSSLGPVFREQGLFLDAEQAYLNAIYCDPNDADAHYNLGILYDLYMQNPMGALDEYKAANSLMKGSDELLTIWIGDLSRRLGVPLEETPPPVIQEEQIEGSNTEITSSPVDSEVLGESNSTVENESDTPSGSVEDSSTELLPEADVEMNSESSEETNGANAANNIDSGEVSADLESEEVGDGTPNTEALEEVAE